MLKGDLSSTTLASVLLDLAADGASGALVLTHPDGEEAEIFLRSGLVCGIHAPEHRSDLGAKLVSSGLIEPEALADALEAQRTDLAAWNLGELLVHLGYVEETVIQGFVTEQLYEALWDLMRWTEGRWKFRKNAKTREDGQPMSVVDLLETLRERGYEWETIAEIVDSPNAVPMLSARGDGAPETTLDSDAWSMLCKIDGSRTVADLAADCGYTLFEAGQVLVTLVDAGLVDIADETEDGQADVYGSASALAGVLAGARNGSHDTGGGAEANGSGDDDSLSRLARLASEVTTAHVSAAAPTTPNPLQLDVMAAQLSGSATNLTVPISRKSGESFATAMDRVAGALVDALGPAPETIDNDPIVVRRRPKPKREEEPVDIDEQRRRRRAAAAAELAQAQAAVESLRPDRKFDAPIAETPPRLVDLEAERARVAAREAEEAARHAAEGAAREAAEKFAREVAEQAARIQLEQAARDTQSRAEEATRLAAEEAARLAAEQAAAEEAAAEQQKAAEAARLAEAAERAQREAAERAAEEATRLAAEQAAAEEAARQATEQAERLAAERAAAEEAARQAAEQLKAEQEARLAAEEAARQAAEQLKAEQEARLAAEEAVRLAEAAERAQREAAERAAEEAAALAAEQAAAEEAARLAAEQAAAEQAAAEQAAAEEAARLAAEQAEAERLAAEEAERLAQAEAAEAARLAQEAEARAALAAAQAEADANAEEERLAQAAAAEAEAKRAAEEAEHAALQEAIARSQQAAETAAATAMLVELHHEAIPEPVAEVPEPEPEPAYEPDPEPEPAPVRSGEGTDTAALLRELSSLGLEDTPSSGLAAAAPPPRPRPNAGAAADKKAKKKIGLFGL